MCTKPDPQIAAFGIDIGKKVFHVVALDAAGAVIQRAKFSRDTLMTFFDAAPKVQIGMEACPGSQWLARRLAAMAHDARIIPALREALCQIEQDRHSRCGGDCRSRDATDDALCRGSDARAG
jgi:hypothetical protein